MIIAYKEVVQIKNEVILIPAVWNSYGLQPKGNTPIAECSLRFSCSVAILFLCTCHTVHAMPFTDTVTIGDKK